MNEWIISVMTSLGYFGIGLLMFLENLFPPIPSELIMPLAGFTVAQGKMSMAPALLSGIAGTVLGAIPWYYAGYSLGEARLQQLADRFGRWLGISGKDIASASRWFGHYGYRAVLFGRLVPGIRTLISIPAGINRMPIGPFLIYSTLGTTVWTALLTYAGFFLGANYGLVDRYLGPLSKIVLLILGVALILWLIQKQRQLAKERRKAKHNLDHHQNQGGDVE